MKALKAVIFDLDGTLIKSRHDYREMTRRIKTLLQREGINLEEGGEERRVWEIIREGAMGLTECGLNPERIEKVLVEITLNLNEVELAALHTVELMPGAISLLRSIKESGLKIGIATRSCYQYSRISMEKLGILDYVDVCYARDQVEFPKPDPRHIIEVLDDLGVTTEEVIYVGDTTTDHQTALSAGIQFIGFPSSDTWRKRMESLGDLIIVSDLEKIINLGLW